jgi:hypothetical protein
LLSNALLPQRCGILKTVGMNKEKKMRFKTGFGFLAALLLGCTTLHADIVDYVVGQNGFSMQDTELSERSSSDVNGSNEDMAIRAGYFGNETSASMVLLSFDGLLSLVNPGEALIGDEIIRATLTLHLGSVTPVVPNYRLSDGLQINNGVPYTIYGLSAAAEGWDQATASFDTMGGFGALTEIGDAFETGDLTSGGTLDLDLTEALKALVDGTFSGIVIGTMDDYAFTENFFMKSSENSDPALRPTLSVDQIPEPAVISFLGLGGGIIMGANRLLRRGRTPRTPALPLQA